MFCVAAVSVSHCVTEVVPFGTVTHWRMVSVTAKGACHRSSSTQSINRSRYAVLLLQSTVINPFSINFGSLCPIYRREDFEFDVSEFSNY